MHVFISSSYSDLMAEREAVALAVEELGGRAVGQEDRVPLYGAEALDLCRRDVERCDLLVSIVGWRYGTVPRGWTRSYTETEYDAAVDGGVKCLAYLLDAPPPASLPAGEYREVTRFRRRLATHGVFFQETPSLRQLVVTAISQHLALPRSVDIDRLDGEDLLFGSAYEEQLTIVQKEVARHMRKRSSLPVFLIDERGEAAAFFMDMLRYAVLPGILGCRIHSVRLPLRGACDENEIAKSIRTFLSRVLFGSPNATDDLIALELSRLMLPVMIRVYIRTTNDTPQLLASVIKYWRAFPEVVGRAGPFVFLCVEPQRHYVWKALISRRLNAIPEALRMLRSGDESVCCLPPLDPVNPGAYLRWILSTFHARGWPIDELEMLRKTFERQQCMPRQELVRALRASFRSQWKK